MADPTPGVPARTLVALVVGQLGIHAAMAGLRLAAPLQALREGHAAWVVGLLMGLFAAAPIVLALQAGRLAERRGYHHPMRIAVALTVLGGAVALAVGAAVVAGLYPAWAMARTPPAEALRDG